MHLRGKKVLFWLPPKTIFWSTTRKIFLYKWQSWRALDMGKEHNRVYPTERSELVKWFNGRNNRKCIIRSWVSIGSLLTWLVLISFPLSLPPVSFFPFLLSFLFSFLFSFLPSSLLPFLRPSLPLFLASFFFPSFR